MLPEGWFPGPWKICDGNSLEKMPRIPRGNILIHKSGNALLNCPKCDSLQFVTAPVEGDATSPTLRGEVVCGSGNCDRCAVRFTIRAGKTVAVTEPAKKTEVDWSHLASRGVNKAPKLPG